MEKGWSRCTKYNNYDVKIRYMCQKTALADEKVNLGYGQTWKQQIPRLFSQNPEEAVIFTAFLPR